MYSLTIHFGPNTLQWQFLFKEKNTVDTYLKIFEMGVAFVDIVDDFGQKSNIRMDQVHGWLLEDMDLVMEARIYRSLENARGEIKAKQRASTDPVIRTAQQGPGVIAPNFGRN
jgi:hypothetical protein